MKNKLTLAEWRAEKAVASTNRSHVTEEAAFYTGKPYIESSSGYAFKYRSYNPELARWTSEDPSGFPDGANGNIYNNNPVAGFDALGLAWGNLDFVRHFYFGEGKDVKLSEIGLFDQVKSLSNTQGYGAYNFGIQIAQTAEVRAKPYNGTFQDSFNNTYAYGGIVWAMGGGVLSGNYIGNMTSVPNTSGQGGNYSYNGIANLNYSDSFTDPLSVIEFIYGSSTSPNVPSWLLAAMNIGGTPYSITDSWNKSYAGGGTYE